MYSLVIAKEVLMGSLAVNGYENGHTGKWRLDTAGHGSIPEKACIGFVRVFRGQSQLIGFGG